MALYMNIYFLFMAFIMDVEGRTVGNPLSASGDFVWLKASVPSGLTDQISPLELKKIRFPSGLQEGLSG